MIYILQYLESMAYFLAMPILFQSCVAYSKIPSTIEQAAVENNPIKITTINGEKYKMDWIEIREESVIGIRNTTREYIDKKKIIHYSVLEPEPRIVGYCSLRDI